MDRQAFLTLLVGLGEYYDKKLSTPVLNVYWEALKHHSIKDLQAAIEHHIKDPDIGQFMPKVANLESYLTGGKQTQAFLAWSEVDRKIRQVGPYQSITFKDPIISKVIIDMGGWVDLCDTPTEQDLKFKAIEFQKRYQGYVSMGGVTDPPKQLTGISDHQNYLEGFTEDGPKKITKEKILKLTKTSY